jgi:hypothetical protein
MSHSFSTDGVVGPIGTWYLPNGAPLEVATTIQEESLRQEQPLVAVALTIRSAGDEMANMRYRPPVRPWHRDVFGIGEGHNFDIGEAFLKQTAPDTESLLPLLFFGFAVLEKINWGPRLAGGG